MNARRWLKRCCALAIPFIGIACASEIWNPPADTPNFSVIKTPNRDYCGSLMTWKIAHPTRRVVSLTPFLTYNNPVYVPGGFIIRSIEMNRQVQQFFITIPNNDFGYTGFGINGLEAWFAAHPEAEVLAMTALHRDSNIEGYLLCVEMPGPALPDSLAHYYASIPVEPNEFTPLADDAAPVVERGSP